jgi:hypothetical protein
MRTVTHKALDTCDQYIAQRTQELNSLPPKLFTLPSGFSQNDSTYVPGQPLPGCVFSREEANLGAEIVRQELEASKKKSSSVKAVIAIVAGLGLMILSHQKGFSEGIKEMQRIIGWIECKTVTVDDEGNPVSPANLTRVIYSNETLYEKAQGWCLAKQS